MKYFILPFQGAEFMRQGTMDIENEKHFFNPALSTGCQVLPQLSYTLNGYNFSFLIFGYDQNNYGWSIGVLSKIPIFFGGVLKQ